MTFGIRGLYVCAAVFAAVVVGSTSAVAQETTATTWDKEALQRLYSEFLSDEGYRPDIDNDGDIRFKKEGRTYYIIVDNKDLQFFRIVLPSYWKIESDEERARVLVAIDVANSSSKVAKTYTVGDQVWSAIEILVAQPEDFKPVFERAIVLLDNAMTTFVKKIRE